MTELRAKPILIDKFWIVEQDGERVGTLHKQDNDRFVLSSYTGKSCFSEKSELLATFGDEFFSPTIKATVSVDQTEVLEAHGYPTNTVPVDPVYDVQKRLPTYRKSKDSKTAFCAGYYTILFQRGWVRSFCPKLSTLDQYQFRGPFKTELEMKQALSNVNSD